MTRVPCSQSEHLPLFFSLALFGSLDRNALCGVGMHGNGTYSAEGINALCQGIKGSAITSLRCAACTCQRWHADQRQQPLTLVGHQHCLALFGSLAANGLGSQGAAAVADGLKGNTALTSLECAAMPNQEGDGRPTSVSSP